MTNLQRPFLLIPHYRIKNTGYWKCSMTQDITHTLYDTLSRFHAAFLETKRFLYIEDVTYAVSGKALKDFVFEHCYKDYKSNTQHYKITLVFGMYFESEIMCFMNRLNENIYTHYKNYNGNSIIKTEINQFTLIIKISNTVIYVDCMLKSNLVDPINKMERIDNPFYFPSVVILNKTSSSVSAADIMAIHHIRSAVTYDMTIALTEQGWIWIYKKFMDELQSFHDDKNSKVEDEADCFDDTTVSEEIIYCD